ncbi:MAG: helix-turn-helix transcriptional regulator [Oscillospiraceae bacterium]
MEIQQLFGKRLQELREKKGETQQQLADAISITRQSLSRYEAAERTMNIELLVKVATHFNVTTDFLLGLSNVKSTELSIKNACEVTGLTEDAARFLSELNVDGVPKLLSIMLTRTQVSIEMFRLLILYCAEYASPLTHRKSHKIGKIFIHDSDLLRIYKSLTLDEFSKLLELTAKVYNDIPEDEDFERTMTHGLSQCEMDLEDEIE